LTPLSVSARVGPIVLPEVKTEWPEGVTDFIAVSKPERPHHEISR
jgi:hypothetical protein